MVSVYLGSIQDPSGSHLGPSWSHHRGGSHLEPIFNISEYLGPSDLLKPKPDFFQNARISDAEVDVSNEESREGLGGVQEARSNSQ